ncbi:MAG: type II 3-dehydroquinate dehydratase [Melioribacteraceae bacterium]|nr:type II 3-dehydroquinate dehydratase [Melioribacteraceae bacterium]
MKILIINGPNLNLLGQREKSNYGELTLTKIEEIIKSEYRDDIFTFFQSNNEGEIIDQIQNAAKNYDGLIINPGGYSHTSVAIRDALEVAKLPKVEVHLSNISAREDFRHRSITAPMTDGYLSGFKEKGYLAAVYLIGKIVK